MLRVKRYIALLFISPILISALTTHAEDRGAYDDLSVTLFQQDTARLDSADSVANLPYAPSKQPTFKPTDRFGDPFSNRTSKSPLVLQDPASLSLDVEIDTAMNYTIYEKIGDINFRPTSAMSFDEFNKYHTSQLIRGYWKDKSLGLDGESAVSGRRLIPKLYISPIFDRIFGGDYVDIQPNGFVNLDFGGRWQRNENPAVSIRRQRNGSFNFDQQISMNVVGKVGEKLAVTANFDNNNTFDFQNDMKVEYTGFDEDIIKKIEIGNVSMPVSNSLITGAQSLFGVKTQLQFGKLFVTGVASRQQGTLNTKRFNPCETNSYAQTGGGNTGIAGGGTDDNVNKKRAWEYAQFQHFFLGHFFRDNYETWLGSYPLINNGSLALEAGRVEVWQLTIGNNDTRSLREVVALTDLGESKMINRPELSQIGMGSQLNEPTDNSANNLMASMLADPNLRDVNQIVSILRGWGLEEDIDFVRAQARKMEVGEYSVNPVTGFLSLRSSLNPSQMVAVSYQYTYNGQRFKVGEVSQDYLSLRDDQVIFLKLIRSPNGQPDHPSWDLMMKNVYQAGGRGSELSMQLMYEDFTSSLVNNSIPEGINTATQPLLQLLELDKLNQNNDNQPDGFFDAIENITVYEGNIVFPILEPFGDNLRELFEANEEELIEKYVFDEIYDELQITASNISDKDFFRLDIVGGQSSGGGNRGGGGRSVATDRTTLPGFNIPAESIVATMGSTRLRAGIDYRVDFNQFVVINDQILNSCQPITIEFEETDLFNFQTKWLTGIRAEYLFNENFNFGATLLRLNERPGGISRFSIGNEPLRNTKYGFDVNYSGESRFLTKMVDFLPLISTKEKSNISFSAEFAQLIPGTSNQVDGESTSYIEDFENAFTPINLGNYLSWKLGATPVTNTNQFYDPSAPVLETNYNRAKLAWYTVDNSVFYRTNFQLTPGHLTEEDLTNQYVRPVLPQEIFTQRDRQAVVVNEPLLDIAFFPEERGPYNYNPNLDPATGFLPNPQESFGAISRANTNNTNFEVNNIEYIEFWLLDPFIDEVDDGTGRTPRRNTTGGELYLNIGSISEDVLRDDRHSFEHGLPEDYDVSETSQNDWGRIPTDSYLTDFFSNNTSARENQDVGLDGLKDEDELANFPDFVSSLDGFNSNVRDRIRADPSGDNFQYYLGDDLDAREAGIIERYKDFNGHQGNSPLGQTSGNFSPGYSQDPDKEDLFGDNGVSSTEQYFEYRIQLRPDLLRVGSQNIVDQVNVPNSDAVWYLFRIPVAVPTRVVGEPTLRDIRFYRMYLTDWQEPVVLRMAKFQMVGSQWRKWDQPLNEPGLNEIPDPSVSDFDVSVVSIEENGEVVEGKSPYVIPPGLNRDQDNTTTIQRRNNEQSIRICVDDLQDQDARAVFKNLNDQGGLDLVNYGRLKMFLHAEVQNDDMVQDGEVTAFLRLAAGNEYYEIEVPLTLTDNNALTLSNADILRREVWPLENEIDLSFDELYALKNLRNNLESDPSRVFARPSANGQYTLKVVGDPKLSAVRVLWIGVRNPKSDDGAPKSVCIWANELRVTDFDKTKGWAAKASLNTNLADFANISASTSYESIGFGGLQQNIIERSRYETITNRVNTTVQAHKLLPGKHGIKIPVTLNYENVVRTPRFDPTDPDIPLDVSLNNQPNQEARSELKSIVQERSTTRSINISNLRKEKVKEDAVPHIYDIENFSFDYAYAETKRSGLVEAEYFDKRFNYGAAYQYQLGDFYIEPFKNGEAFSSPYLQLIKDINFNPLPNNISVRADLNRNFRSIRNRDPLDYTPLDTARYIKTFYLDRNYAMKWNVMKNLSLDYGANVNAIIDEPEGEIDQEAIRQIRSSIKNLGRMRQFNQNVSANFTVPLDKIPFTDWVTASARYQATYNWTSGSVNLLDSIGSVIQNTRNTTVTSGIDMVTLYNKVKFLKDINSPPRRRSRGRPPSRADTVKTNDSKALKSILRLLMSVRSIKLNYSLNEGTTLPGVSYRPFLFGLDSSFNAPGVPFLLGSQDPNVRIRAGENGWLVDNEFLNNPFIQTRTETIGLQGSIEPFKDFRIQLDANRTISGNFQEVYKALGGEFTSITPSRSGAYSLSFNTIRTAFEGTGENFSSKAFTQFEENIGIIKNRLDDEILSPGSSFSYDSISQDVLIPAFLHAYSGRDANSSSLNPFPQIPIPNWRLDYAGLSKIPKLSEVFSSINLTHAYRSVYDVNNYVSNFSFDNVPLDLDNQITDYPFSLPLDENVAGSQLQPVYVVNQVSITEQFAPFIGLNIRTKNKMSIKFDYKKERTLSLNLSNSQIAETKRNNVTMDFSVAKTEYTIPFRIRGRKVTLENELTFRTAVSITDSKTIQRKIFEDAEITNGDTNIRLRPTLDYKYNERLNVTAYFERTITEPRIGSFPRRTTAFGFQVRFSLAQ